MASVSKVSRKPTGGRPQVSWMVRYRDPDHRQKARTFARKAEASRFAVAVEHSITAGTYVDPELGRLSVSEWATRWLDGARPTLKPKTVDSYESLIESRIVPALGGRRVSSLRPSDIQKWVGGMQSDGISASRVRQAHVTLKQIFDAALRDGAIGRNPALGVKLPRLEHKEADYFEPEVVDRIADALAEPYDLLVRLLGTLGLRWGEGAALERRHVDFLKRRLIIEQSLAEVKGKLILGSTKTHATRAIPLSPGLVGALLSHLETRVGPEPTARVFTSPSGGDLRYSDFAHRVWRPTLKRLGLPHAGVHVLRHSAAARLIGAGASPKAVQTILGHRSIAFSLTTYGHLFPSDLDDLASRLDAPIQLSRPGQ